MNSVAGRTILVTGGAGFIGSTTVDQLLEAGAAEVRVIDNLVRGQRGNLEAAMQTGRLVFLEEDIRDADSVDAAVRGVDSIIHLAALRITRCAEQPREAVEVLIHGTSNVLESARRHHVSKVVAASSASVYGNASYLPMDEDHPFNNRTLYGAGKIANEQMLRAYFESYGLPYVAFRYFNVYGPRMDLDGVYTEVLIRWMDAIEAGESPRIFGDGSQSMDFVHVKDVAAANIKGLISPCTDEVFNVGTGVQTTLLQLCHLLLATMDSELQPVFCEARKVNNVQARRAAIEKAHRLLGFDAAIDLAAGLRDLVAWRSEAKLAAAAAMMAGAAR